MAEPNGICKEHSGCLARIAGLEKSEGEQWDHMNKMDSRIDAIFTRLNIILGGVVVACIMLAINIIVRR